MTIDAIATLFHARSLGRGRYVANCPAHEDRSPSLSIREGEDGRVLVHCFAGCTLTAILASHGLIPRDLFVGPPPSSAKLRELTAERARADIEAAILRTESRKKADRVRTLYAVVDAIGETLVRQPGNDELAALLHAAIDKFHEAEYELGGSDEE
jgi:putative DNA primase/helicase